MQRRGRGSELYLKVDCFLIQGFERLLFLLALICSMNNHPGKTNLEEFFLLFSRRSVSVAGVKEMRLIFKFCFEEKVIDQVAVCFTGILKKKRCEKCCVCSREI